MGGFGAQPHAVYDAAHSTSTSLAFDYTVGSGQYTNALSVTGVNLNGATVTEIAGIEVRQPTRDDLPIIGRSAVMQDIYRILARLTQTDQIGRAHV